MSILSIKDAVNLFNDLFVNISNPYQAFNTLVIRSYFQCLSEILLLEQKEKNIFLSNDFIEQLVDEYKNKNIPPIDIEYINKHKLFIEIDAKVREEFEDKNFNFDEIVPRRLFCENR